MSAVWSGSFASAALSSQGMPLLRLGEAPGEFTDVTGIDQLTYGPVPLARLVTPPRQRWAAPTRLKNPACHATRYQMKLPGRVTYRFAASIASALRATLADTPCSHVQPAAIFCGPLA